jgi:predicted ester cyclase
VSAVALVDRFWSLVLRGREGELRDLLAPDYCLYEHGRLALRGPQAGAARLAAVRAMLPDLAVRIHERIVLGALVRERWTLGGTHLGPTPAGTPASGRPVTIHGAGWVRCREDQIAEVHHWFDAAAVAAQLAGATAPAPSPLGLTAAGRRGARAQEPRP